MAKRICVYGGKGALGSVILDAFKASGWWTLNVDMVANDKSDANVVVEDAASLTDQAQQVRSGVSAALGEGRLDSIVCVAGGWAGGNAASEDFVGSVEKMGKQSVWSSVIAASLAAHHLSPSGLLVLTGAVPSLGATAGMIGYGMAKVGEDFVGSVERMGKQSVIAASLAAHHLNPSGLLVLTGAVPSLGATAGMIGYGMAKASVHQLVASLGAADSGIPVDAGVLAILPVTLDTPMNRKWMAKADFSTWTPLEFVAKQIAEWSEGSGSRPPRGSLVQLHTKDGHTSLVIKPFA